MIYEVKQNNNTYSVDDLKPLDQQTKGFQAAFNKAETQVAVGIQIVEFDNANATLYTESGRILISLKELEDENN